MNRKQFERKVEAVEKMLSDVRNRLFGMFLRYATEEELETLARVFRAVVEGGDWNSISEEMRKEADLAFVRMQKRAKHSSRPHSRKLIPYLPSPKEEG